MAYSKESGARKLKAFGRGFDHRDPTIRACQEVGANAVIYDEMLDEDAGIMVPTLRSLVTGERFYGSVEDGQRLAHYNWCVIEEATTDRPLRGSTLDASWELYLHTGEHIRVDFDVEYEDMIELMAQEGFAVFDILGEITIEEEDEDGNDT